MHVQLVAGARTVQRAAPATRGASHGRAPGAKAALLTPPMRARGSPSLRALRRPLQGRRPSKTYATSEPEATGAAGEVAQASATFSKTLVCVLDPNPYLSTGTRQLLATAAALDKSFKGTRLSIVCLDDNTWEFDNDVRFQTIRWHLTEHGCEEYDLAVNAVSVEEGPLAVTVADLADDMEATLLLLTTDSVEEGFIDANMLAKFVGCSFLFVE